ncbi:MAG TPA: prolyl oligopeptidase family serine peptidase [Terriglobales bacterium]|nr:prolyl oligopeptidase family serine peptidase [Terriglobales bacterium]
MKSAFLSCSVLVLVVLMSLSLPCSAAASSPTDPWLWLEDVTGDKALQWVKQQNEQSTRELAGTPQFKALDARFLDILNSRDKIPFVTKIGDRYYNFWRDARHERGLWRRTTLEEYRKPSPAWETVIDLDSLAAAEKENWVWHGAQPLPPEYRLCLVMLSRGGADAQVVREFDLVTRSFVPGGFTLPESKSEASWIDRDHLYVGFAFDSTTMTTSGYPRIVKEWTRGTPLASATPVYEGEREDVSVNAFRDHTPGFVRDFVLRGMTFYTNEMFLRRDGKLIKIAKPDDADAGVWREWLLIQPRKDWRPGARTYLAGSLLAAKLDDFLAGSRDLAVLFEPSARISLAGYSTTRHAILVNELDNVKNRLYVLGFEDGRWTRIELAGQPAFGTLSAGGVDDYESDDYWLTATGFLTPTTLSLGTIGNRPAEELKHAPRFFDGGRDTVTQHDAISKDGTRIPYFEVAPRTLVLDGSAPTLLTGYGGFEISELPSYNGVRGSGWIERGGVLVVANIRGGGEFGPKWHQAGVKDQRHHCYEDFIAVAEDLIQRKVTSPRRLGCMGASNGGLLVGNMLTMRPDLWGAVVCESPLLDMKRYHKLLAGASWMSEYGDPDDPSQWGYIHAWSPYQNVKTTAKYPPALFTSSTRDDRVHPGHARKMVARMKDRGKNVLYYENVEGGHAGAANNKQSAFMSALAYTFLWKELGGAADSTGTSSGAQPGRP